MSAVSQFAVVGVDASPAALEQAARLAARRGERERVRAGAGTFNGAPGTIAN